MIDLSIFSEMKSGILWAYYDTDLNDFTQQMELAKAKHGVKSGDPVCCICRPMSIKNVTE